jgi:ribosomal protein L13E
VIFAPAWWTLQGGTDREYGFYRSLFERGLNEGAGFTVDYPVRTTDGVRFNVRGKLFGVAVDERRQTALDRASGRDVDYTPIGDLDAF